MEVFNKLFREYDQWYEDNKWVFLSEVEALRKVIPKGKKGLEIGVGTGRFAKILGIEYGIDPSEKMLSIAKERGIKTFVGRGEDLPLEYIKEVEEPKEGFGEGSFVVISAEK